MSTFVDILNVTHKTDERKKTKKSMGEECGGEKRREGGGMDSEGERAEC